VSIPHTPPGERLHALDAARGLALLLGIALHASMSFFLPVPAQDVSSSAALGVGFYVIHSFRMSLFFLLAGFFGRMLWQRLGPRGFLRDRARRILLPMTAGWLLLAPLTIAIVIWGLSRTFPDGAPAGSPPPQQGFPLTHLWFLYYLSLFYLGAAALCAVFSGALDSRGQLGQGFDAALRVAVVSRLAPVPLAAPLFVVLFLDAGWDPWFGIRTPDTGLMPQLPALVGYGTAFAVGWMLQRQTGLLALIERQWPINLALGALLSTLCLALIGPAPDLIAANRFEGQDPARALYAAAYTLSIWCWSLGLLGAALRFLAAHSPTRRYLADASYFIYLAHLPLVFGLQVLVMDWPLHWSIKYPLIIAATLGLLLPAYHWLVRPTVIGAILNGRRQPRGKVPTMAPPLVQAAGVLHPADASAVAVLRGVSKRYGERIALHPLDLEVRPGQVLALLGPNGAGKTTAINLWLGMLQPDSGSALTFAGTPGDVHSRLGTGVMLQDVQLAPMLSAREQITQARRYYRAPLTVEETLQLAGIEGIADQRHGKLSTGQKRQVQFALAVCGRPRLLFLDEPTVGLDVDARERMWRSIRGLVERGGSVVLTTHYLEEAEALADRVAVLAEGRLVAEGSVAEVRAQVSRTRIRCISALDADALRAWPGVIEVSRSEQQLQLTAIEPEGVVRRLLDADPHLVRLEVRPASLADAFQQLTREAA
jgi:ABC-type multidrug transport system ATPase subunit